MPYFTIVIPLYNKEMFVEDTIESILAQTFQDFEIIVVDDCSTDSGPAIVRKFEGSQLRIISHESNRGLSASRNTGIKNAQSDYIAFLDADDTWKPDFLEKIHELIHSCLEAGLFATAYEEKYLGDVAIGIHKNVDLADGEMKVIDDFFVASAKQPILWYGATVVRKEVFSDVGPFDEQVSWYEDVDFNIRANLKHKLAFYNSPCAYYTIHSQNQITKSNINQRKVCDLSKYEQFTIDNPSLKLYLDVNRYALAMDYKLGGNNAQCKKIYSEIDPANLTLLQKILLALPASAVRQLKNIKALFLKKGIRLTTFTK